MVSDGNSKLWHLLKQLIGGGGMTQFDTDLNFPGFPDKFESAWKCKTNDSIPFYSTFPGEIMMAIKTYRVEMFANKD